MQREKDLEKQGEDARAPSLLADRREKLRRALERMLRMEKAKEKTNG